MIARRELIKRLKPYWDKRKELMNNFSEEERKLEREMNEDLGKEYDFKLGFEYGLGSECTGIGAVKFENHPGFPLVTDSELERGK